MSTLNGIQIFSLSIFVLSIIILLSWQTIELDRSNKALRSKGKWQWNEKISTYAYLKMFLIANYAITMGEYPKLLQFNFIFYFLIAIFTSGWIINNNVLLRLLKSKK